MDELKQVRAMCHPDVHTPWVLVVLAQLDPASLHITVACTYQASEQ